VPLFRARIPDWRSMVDCVVIDAVIAMAGEEVVVTAHV
jgi:hypothetical protein